MNNIHRHITNITGNIMEQTTNVQLFNRYGSDIYLKHVNDTSYELCSSDKGTFDYMRIGRNNKTSAIEFIDPAGGPFICVDNFTVYGKKLKEINTNEVGTYLLIFEK